MSRDDLELGAPVGQHQSAGALDQAWQRHGEVEREHEE